MFITHLVLVRPHHVSPWTYTHVPQTDQDVRYWTLSSSSCPTTSAQPQLEKDCISAIKCSVCLAICLQCLIGLNMHRQRALSTELIRLNLILLYFLQVCRRRRSPWAQTAARLSNKICYYLVSNIILLLRFKKSFPRSVLKVQLFSSRFF